MGDVLLLREGQRLPVTQFAVRQARQEVYNLQIEGLHCFAVGACQVLVHNYPAPTEGEPTPPENSTNPLEAPGTEPVVEGEGAAAGGVNEPVNSTAAEAGTPEAPAARTPFPWSNAEL